MKIIAVFLWVTFAIFAQTPTPADRIEAARKRPGSAEMKKQVATLTAATQVSVWGQDYLSALVHGRQPTVAIMHNGTRKGGTVQTMRMLYSSPGLEDVWQLHWAYSGGLEYNSPGLFIANPEDPAAIAAFLTNPASAGRMFGAPPPAGATPGGPPPAGAPTAPAAGGPAAPPANSQAQGGPPAGRGPGGGGGFGGGRGGGHTGQAFWIKVSAKPDGTFTVTNTRNNFSKTYVQHN